MDRHSLSSSEPIEPFLFYSVLLFMNLCVLVMSYHVLPTEYQWNESLGNNAKEFKLTGSYISEEHGEMTVATQKNSSWLVADRPDWNNPPLTCDLEHNQDLFTRILETAFRKSFCMTLMRIGSRTSWHELMMNVTKSTSESYMSLNAWIV